MAGSQLQLILHQLHTSGGVSVPDRDLLERFVGGHDEAAFHALVERHGPMVLRVCRSVLRHAQDAEDAFQGTFLVLARKAASLRCPETLACWLHGVARRVAGNLKATLLRRPSGAVALEPVAREDPVATVSGSETCAAIDEELARLGQAYRAPLLLCCLGGLTREQAARQLGWSLATLKRRLARGRRLLRARLQRRGLALGTALIAPLPAGLAASTARTAFLTAGGAKAGAVVRLKTILGLVLVLGILAGGGLATIGSRDPLPSPIHTKPAPRVAVRAPLPEGALVRLGDTRFRHDSLVKGIAFLPDGKSLVSADWDGARLWDVATGEVVRHFRCPRAASDLQAIALSPDSKVLAESNGSGLLRLWDVASGRLLHQVPCGLFAFLAFSPDSQTLASVAWRKEAAASTLRLWDVKTCTPKRVFLGHDGHGLAVAFSSDGKTLFTSERSRNMRLWDTVTGKALGSLGRTPAHLAVSPDGKVLATIQFKDNRPATYVKLWRTDSEIVLFDARTRKELRRLVVPQKVPRWPSWGDGGGLHELVFTPDSRTLLSCDPGQAIHAWDVSTGKERLKIPLAGKLVYALAVSPDGRTLATGGFDQTIHLWDLATGKEVRRPVGHQEAVSAVVLSPDRRLVASGGADRTVRVWDRRTGRELRCLRGHESNVQHLAFADGGRTLISAGADRTLRFWDIPSGHERRKIEGVAPVLAMSPDGKALIEMLNAGRLHEEQATFALRDLTTGKAIQRFAQASVLWHAGFSPDRRRLFVCGEEKRIHVWDVDRGKELRTFGGFKDFTNQRSDLGVAFAPDGQWVAVGGEEQRRQGCGQFVVLYDLSTGKQLVRIADIGRPMAFSPDGRRLACLGRDGKSVHLIETATGRQSRCYHGHQGIIKALAFSGDGRFLVTASADTTLLVWDLLAPQPSKGTSW
jgi:RNA polymerase sigma factor (sigma-70 family)